MIIAVSVKPVRNDANSSTCLMTVPVARLSFMAQSVRILAKSADRIALGDTTDMENQ